MKITVLSIHGMSAAEEGWRLSRDVTTKVHWPDIFTVDVPVNELPTVLLHFQDFTIYEREIFMSPRNHVAWARTSHVDDPMAFVVPPELMEASDPGFYDNCRHIMRRRREAGASQDEWRENLPVASTTSWTMRTNFRDLVKITGYFDYLASKVAVGAVYLRMREVHQKLLIVVAAFCRGSMADAQKAIASMSPARFLHEGDMARVIPGRTTSDGHYLIRLHVPLWLRAQIVRHRALGFVDNFYHQVLTSPDLLMITIAEQLTMELSTTKDFWRTVMSKRSCWIAQDSLLGKKDPWQAIIDSFGFSEEMLPCADGHCPYAKDASLRLTKADPGTPCPEYMNINKLDKEPYREEMYRAADSRHQFWRERIES
jgi:hypothetical protein